MTERQAVLQTLRERLVALGRPIVIVGGIRKRDKIQALHERFGIDTDWFEIEEDSPNSTDAIVKRIKSGRIGAVILLEGLMGHKVSKNVRAACQSSNVPFTTGGKGGIGNLEQALNELDRRISL